MYVKKNSWVKHLDFILADLLSIYKLYIFIKNLMYILVFIIFIICFVHIYTTSIKITYTLI